MSKERRVRELAKELGYQPQELVTKIIDLGIMQAGSVNVMTKLNEDEISQVKRDLKKSTQSSKASSSSGASSESKAPASKEEGDATSAGAGAPVMRRKSERKKDAPVATIAAGEETESVGPVMIRRSKSRSRHVVGASGEEITRDSAASKEAPEQEDAAATPVAEEAAPPSAKDLATPVAGRAQEEAPASSSEAKATATPEATTEAAASTSEKSEEATEAAAAPVRTPEADAPAATAPAAQTPASDAPKQEKSAGEVTTTPAAPAAAASSSASTSGQRARIVGTVDLNRTRPPEKRPESAQARPPVKKAPAASPGGAQVLGIMDAETINSRIEGRVFELPDPNGEKSDRRERHNRNKRRGQAGGAYESADSRNKRGKSGREVRDIDSLYGDRRKRKKKIQKKTEITTAAEHKRVVRIEDTITVGELGRQMGVKAGMLALKLMEMGMMANVNTTLDFETAQLIAMEFNHTVENVAFDIANFYDTSPDDEETLESRPPVVTVMGHVDHGKTSLLDAIRSADVISTEAGGITQHIGAYTVHTKQGGIITFLDTPGHEAFTALRARGAQATDIVVLVVAADDGVMPQTVEAINHARDAGVEIIVAINKIDKPAANVMRIKQALMEYELIAEDFGGDTPFLEVSAKQGINITSLIEEIALRAEIAELSANPNRDAQGIVIESQLDVGRGPLATVLVQRGTLKQGDIVVIGEHYGRVRTMADHRQQQVIDAGPSVPVELTGLDGVPEAGEPFFVVKEERIAKNITQNVSEQRRQKRMAALSKSGMEKLLSVMNSEGGGSKRKLKVIIKADVQGSIEALRQSFEKIGNDEVSVEVIHSAVGGITNNDVNLAASSDEAVVIIGFNVRPDPRATETAEKYDVQIMTFTIIYDAIDQISGLVEGMLTPIKEEKVIGQAEVRETFQAPKVGTIAGCYVTSGLLRRNARARLWRDGKLIYESTLGSLRRFKDNVTEVKSGFECGTSLENYNDIKIGDVIEAYEIIEVAAKL